MTTSVSSETRKPTPRNTSSSPLHTPPTPQRHKLPSSDRPLRDYPPALRLHPHYESVTSLFWRRISVYQLIWYCSGRAIPRGHASFVQTSWTERRIGSCESLWLLPRNCRKTRICSAWTQKFMQMRRSKTLTPSSGHSPSTPPLRNHSPKCL